jgi:hypothetical protein
MLGSAYVALLATAGSAGTPPLAAAGDGKAVRRVVVDASGGVGGAQLPKLAAAVERCAAAAQARAGPGAQHHTVEVEVLNGVGEVPLNGG